jgi:hypothetical protein
MEENNKWEDQNRKNVDQYEWERILQSHRNIGAEDRVSYIKEELDKIGGFPNTWKV